MMIGNNPTSRITSCRRRAEVFGLLSRVALLDPLVAQQVAAGEVVDRPASVVKELCENALDAGASRVEVEIADGGRERVLVRDDGSGMGEEDAKLSVLRHATSKIRTASDIESVMTLGFRGEALPSVASVSAFSLTTATGQGAGTSVTTDGGGNVSVSPASHPKGTTVLVDRLFYNVPARRAFLKGARAERAAVVETMTNLAIAHPGVMFRLAERGNEVLSLPAANDLVERLAQLYGVGTARAMRRVDHEAGAFKVSGYAALPSVTEASRSRQTVSVNGRWVRAEALTKGVDDAYRATVAAGRYPPVALRVEVDPRQVDVNVHPTKQLVRFSDEKEVRQVVSEAVRNAIQGTGDPAPDQDGRGTEPEPRAPTHLRPARAATERPWPQGSVILRRGTRRTGRALPYLRQEADRPPMGVLGLFGEPLRNLRGLRIPSAKSARPLGAAQGAYNKASAPLSRAGSAPGVERGSLPHLRDLRVVGQIGAGYILVDEPMAAWIVDQHVAHERALLDRLTDPEAERMPTIQSLLIPEVVELEPRDAAQAADSLEELSVYGFEVEPFGKASFRINGVISTLAQRDVAGAFRQAVSVMKGTASGMSREERILATIACHSAVKLGDRLSHPEMEALIKEWLGSRYPATCPHGARSATGSTTGT
jgi:DNA mismatch repair protein MutL